MNTCIRIDINIYKYIYIYCLLPIRKITSKDDRGFFGGRVTAGFQLLQDTECHTGNPQSDRGVIARSIRQSEKKAT